MLKATRRPAVLALAFFFALSSVAVAGVHSAPQLDFRLRTADGGEISSEMLKGDVVVLAFGASWLGLPRKHFEGVQELADEFGAREVRIYWVSTDSDSPKSKNYASDEQLRAYARRNNLKVAVLRDPDGALFKRTGADQLPAVVILNRTGEISGAPLAGFDPRRSLTEALSGRLNQLVAAN